MTSLKTFKLKLITHINPVFFMKPQFTFRFSTQKLLLTAIAICFLIVAKATIHTVQVANFSFTPNAVNAVVGDTMEWQWVSGNHTTTSLTVPGGAASWNSPMTSSTQTFQYKITTAGTYTYDCTIHSSVMTGTITVTGGGGGHTEAPTTVFQMGYGIADTTSDAAGTCVQQTFDGGFISTGYISNYGGGSDDFYLVKTDNNGVVSWVKSYGDTSADDANYVIQTADSGYAMTGPSYSYGGQTVLLIKTDATGTVQWAKTYGTGDGSSDASSSSMKQTADGGYIITGYVSNYGAGNDDYYLLKTDASGNIQWSKTYGGGGNDDAACVALTGDGGYIVCGTTTSFGDTTMGNIYVVKTDATGTLQWSKDYGSNDGMDMGNSIQQTTDGGYIIGGVTMGPAFGEFAILIKTDNTGAITWTKAYGTGDASSDASAAFVQQTADSGYVFTGYISNYGAGSDDYYLVKTNANGDTVFTKTYGSSSAEDAYFVTQTTDNGYIVAGNTFGFHVGGQHLYLVKTDSMGNTPCHQYNTATTINTSVTFTVYPTVDTVSTGGVATTVTVISATGGGPTDFCANTSGVNPVAANADIQVYPNPSSGQFQITSSTLIQNLEVYDITGRTVYTRQINADNTSIDLTGHAKGVYLIRLYTGDESTVKKIVVSN